ncbi:acetylcholine receptor subunit alpha-like 2 [Littorina saxatilis]|uniref:acetylcholine receptor subunit alpha-like 2 n=1 Tax=Littorina saxatilis TaxID=31220 RepID=UPI0038B5C939
MAKVFILLLFFAKCQAEVFSNGSALYQLHTDLFKGYLPHVRPVKNVTTVTEVKVTVYILAIEELDLRHQTLSQSIFMDLTWRDEFLSWDPQDYAGLSKIYIQQKHLWIPDLIFGPRAAEQSTKLGELFSLCS